MPDAHGTDQTARKTLGITTGSASSIPQAILRGAHEHQVCA
jgi:hypothetical protein